MINQERGFETFLKGWAPEFGRSVQSLEGEKPVVTWELTSDEPGVQTAEENEGFFWWQQPFAAGQSYSVWVGTPAKTISDLTSKVAGASGDPTQSYIDLLNQSFDGVAHGLNWDRHTPILCEPGTGQDHPPLIPLRIATVTIVLRGRQLAPVLIGAEPGFDRMLESSRSVEPVLAESLATSERAESQELKPFFERLIELELPVSIVLGRSVVALRDVLKYTAGSLIELDRHVGDPAEIVVSNAVIARGEVVSVKGNYGIRVQEVISRNDRIALQTSVRKAPAALPGHSS